MIIGLCGYARSGKDALAGVLGEEWDFHRYAFADVVKEKALVINPWIAAGRGHVRLADLVAGIGWEASKTHSPDVRGFLQALGTTMREVDADIWLGQVMRRVMRDNHENVVVTDVRFTNEARWIRGVGHLVRVIRPGVGPANGHESETAVDHVKAYEFINGGDLEDLAFYGARLPHMLRGLVGVTSP